MSIELFALVFTVGALIVVAYRVRPLPGARSMVTATPRRTNETTRMQLTEACIDLLDQMTRDVRSGISLTAAATTALRAHPRVLPIMRTSLDAGVALADAAEAARFVDTDEARLIAHTLYACATVGGAIADALDRAAAALRERRAFILERTAQSAQARLSAMVMTLVPLVFAAWGAVSSVRVRSQYVHSSVAAFMAGLGLALNLAGWRWMRATIDGPDR